MIHPSNKIHSSAIITGDVVLGENNIIEANCILDGNIKIGNNNHFRTGVLLKNNVEIGNNNQFFPYVTIGYRGEMGAKGDRLIPNTWVRIKNGITLREYVNVHSPVRTEETLIEDDCYVMNKAYLAHDVKLRNNVMISAGCLLGGTVEIQQHANLGMGATVHQRKTIGESAMLGMQATAHVDIPPFCIVVGVSSKILKFNKLGAIRRGFDENEVEIVSNNFKDIINGHFEMDHYIVKNIQSFYSQFPTALRQFRV